MDTDGSIGYTVPQKISGTCDVTLSFRPRRPMNDVVFCAWQGDKCLAKKRVKKALPAEMLHLQIKGDAFVSNETVKVVTEHA